MNRVRCMMAESEVVNVDNVENVQMEVSGTGAIFPCHDRTGSDAAAKVEPSTKSMVRAPDM